VSVGSAVARGIDGRRVKRQEKKKQRVASRATGWESRKEIKRWNMNILRWLKRQSLSCLSLNQINTPSACTVM
jgi:hypothetical protein